MISSLPFRKKSPLREAVSQPAGPHYSNQAAPTFGLRPAAACVYDAGRTSGGASGRAAKMAGGTFPVVRHSVDLCVVGGGMAGFTAALAAARNGARTLLMHERPVLGGNSSSECRVHIGGADRHGALPNMRETGILEELRLENLRRNPQKSFSVWDAILYEKARFQPGLELLLNCTCIDAHMDGRRIESVTGWQLTTETFHVVKARIFADCSGDAVLAPLTGADFRVGREARSEFGESLAPERADLRTMGLTCMFQAREHDAPQPFEPPPWAYRFESDSELPYGAAGHRSIGMGYWWIELGGEQDSLRDAELLRDELLRIVYGVWDHIKNRGDHGAENWALDWVQFLPAKRESRRYVGEHVLTQLDVESGGRFDDVVAYGGWTMDDHHPAGFRGARLGFPATVFHEAPSPYGIPYRSLFSRNISNLMFAGRCASATHVAMSSARVMGTGASMGQAVGTAAALAARKGLEPRELLGCIRELQQTLLRDDCYLPGVRLELSELTRTAALSASEGDPEPVRDGFSRPVGPDAHSWTCPPGAWLEYRFARPSDVSDSTLVLDSALDRHIAMSYFVPHETRVPDAMPRAFRLEGLSGGAWAPLAAIRDNHQRLVRIKLGKRLEGVRFVLESTWGGASSRVYAFYVD